MSLHARIADCARQKVLAALESPKWPKTKGLLLLGADTVVIHNETVLVKPTDEQDAFRILAQLSGQVHDVVTGFCLYDTESENLIMDHEVTKVQFRQLDDQMIHNYIESGEPMDKAGAYGIQGLGGDFVESYEGSFLNVVGLPIEHIEKVCEQNEWSLKKQS